MSEPNDRSPLAVLVDFVNSHPEPPRNQAIIDALNGPRSSVIVPPNPSIAADPTIVAPSNLAPPVVAPTNPPAVVLPANPPVVLPTESTYAPLAPVNAPAGIPPPPINFATVQDEYPPGVPHRDQQYGEFVGMARRAHAISTMRLNGDDVIGWDHKIDYMVRINIAEARIDLKELVASYITTMIDSAVQAECRGRADVSLKLVFTNVVKLNQTFYVKPYCEFKSDRNQPAGIMRPWVRTDLTPNRSLPIIFHLAEMGDDVLALRNCFASLKIYQR